MASCHTHTRRTRPTATQDSTAGRPRAVKLQNASTLCCSHDEPDLGPLAEAGASGRQPCRVPSQILQRLTASCSVCQCSSVKTRLSNCDVGAAQRIAIKDRFCASRQHLFVTTFTCQPLDVTPPNSAACAMKRFIARVVQMLPADGHQPWLGVDAKARHQKTTKGMQSFPLSAIGARRLKSFVHWKLTLRVAFSHPRRLWGPSGIA